MRLYEIQSADEHDARINGILMKTFGDIQQRCSQILHFYYENIEKNSKNVYFYHGTRQRNNIPAYKAKAYSGRSPKDTNYRTHQMFSDWMDALGLVATRDNSMFMTSDFRQAHEDYGQPYIIFPVDGFDYAWSPNFKDMFADIGNDFLLKDTISKLDPDSLADMKWFEQTFDFQDTGLERALWLGHEVMVTGEYYAINSTFDEEVDQFVRMVG